MVIPVSDIPVCDLPQIGDKPGTPPLDKCLPGGFQVRNTRQDTAFIAALADAGDRGRQQQNPGNRACCQ